MSFPARVHIILAREARSAIAIRRGPAKSVCTIGWNLKNDTFKIGQWFKGRIYERRCDLSPDGRHFIYFAMNGKWSSQVKGSWTAISRSPYLKALGLWENGGCWNGGGLFMDNRSYWLNKLHRHEPHLIPANLVEYTEFPFHESYGGECPGVYYIKLQRDDWRFTNHERDHSIFEKSLPKGWILTKIAHSTMKHPVGAGCYYDTHSLFHPKRELYIDCADWEWADLDEKRLVWVSKGILYATQLARNGLGNVQTLYDFNPLRFEAIRAPY